MSKVRTLKHAFRKMSSACEVARHDYCEMFSKAKAEVSSLRLVEIPTSKVLVVGSGYNYPEVLLWSSFADIAVGVDVSKVFWRNGVWALVRDFRAGGKGQISSFARAFVRRQAYSGYYDHLRKLSKLQLDEHHQNLVASDGIRLPFADEAFDIVCSNAVLEHVSNLDGLCDELHRVTKPSGVCYHLWHNYYSLSGAHVPDDLALAHPWGHLLGDQEVEAWLRFTGTYLNKKLPSEIAAVLDRRFKRVSLNQLDRSDNKKGTDEKFEYEGARLFSPELETQLSAYGREVLLTRAYSFLGVRE